MSFSAILNHFSKEAKLGVEPRPYFNHAVQFKKVYSREERMKVLEEVGLNVFFFPAEMVTGCDMLSDSGVTTMTNEQWASLHFGDESYGSNAGYFLLRDEVRSIFGKDFWNDQTAGSPNAFLFHQGRACEDALFSHLKKVGKNLIIPSNGHFDTTHANIEANGIRAVNLFSPELKDEKSKGLFKGNLDIIRLKKLLEKSHSEIPLVYITVTNNTGGGQPVSLANIREVSELVHSYKIPLFLDACRFAENAWFIRENEKEWQGKSVREIVLKMFSFADGFTASFKKDGLANMGGGLFIKNKGFFHKKYPFLLDELMNYQIIKEGHPTYGGMSGRDIMTLVYGLRTIVREEYLTFRIRQIQRFAEKLTAAKIPIVLPAGGHAVYLDMNRFFEGTKMKPGDFGGVAFTAVLLAGYGHRGCELGYFAFGSYDPKTGKETHPEVNFVRFAIPRLRYEDPDLDSVVEAIREIHEHRKEIPPVDVVSGKELSLRHFKAKFRFRS